MNPHSEVVLEKKVCVFHNNVGLMKNNGKVNVNCYCLISLKQTVKYLLQNCFVKYGSQIFLQAIGFPVGSDLPPFFADLCLFHYESEWIVKMKNIDHHQARTFGHVYRFIDVLNFINDNGF